MTNQARRGFFLVVLFLTSFLSQWVYAQGKIEVASFNRMETDITARVTAPKRDQNGEVCALVRIVTTVKDLMFEPDALGITARENKPGEIWLYVPSSRQVHCCHHFYFQTIHRPVQPYRFPDPLPARQDDRYLLP